MKSFGGIKGLLTFADIKANNTSSQIKDLKVGSIVKAYVLFRKKDKGMALTLDKAKAKELRSEVEKSKPQKSLQKERDEKEEEKGNQINTFEDYFPKEEEAKELQDKYKSLIKTS